MSFNNDMPLLVNQLPVSVDFPREQEKFLETLSLLYKKIAQAVNTKEGGLYSLQELYNSNQYFTPGNPQKFRNVYRKVFDVTADFGGPIPPAATVSNPHNINGILFSTLIYASCTSTVPEFFTVVYPDVFLNATNYSFTNSSPNNLTQVFLIAEYLKN